MSNIAIVLSGDAEKDALELKRAKTFDERISEGFCPNGCAELTWETAYNARCLICDFLYSTNLPYGKRECEQVM